MTCGCVLVDGVDWLSNGEVQGVEAAGVRGVTSQGMPLGPTVLHPTQTEGGETQAMGETETVFVKQSEARTIAHLFDKAF